ncbi:hypothetical protein AK972_3006 [Pseudomonas yamanorum]|nr:hypothetical protein AK972_3006 [Pseudomonas yamanorum]
MIVQRAMVLGGVQLLAVQQRSDSCGLLETAQHRPLFLSH